MSSTNRQQASAGPGHGRRWLIGITVVVLALFGGCAANGSSSGAGSGAGTSGHSNLGTDSSDPGSIDSDPGGNGGGSGGLDPRPGDWDAGNYVPGGGLQLPDP